MGGCGHFGNSPGPSRINFNDPNSTPAAGDGPEAKLLASELRYRRLFESAKDGILILDAATGAVVDVNPYLIACLGFSREEFIGKRIWELGFFKDIVASKASFAELQENEYIRYEDKPLETADGQRMDVEFISNVYLVDEEKVIQCEIRDITARKATERQLREQSEILANAHEGVMIVSLANTVTFWNRGAENIFGWSAAEAPGHTPEQLVGLVDPAIVQLMRTTVDREGFWNGEFEGQTRAGVKLVVDCRVTLVRDEAGRPRARLKFLADITEKKLLEEKFLRVQRLEAIGTLSSGIAHDLNNILAPILMAAGLLRETIVDPRDRELMALIENSSRRAADIIRQLLTFGRGIEGRRVSVQVRHLMKEMAAIVRETFPRNLAMVERADPDLWLIAADATQLHQVLMNLCVNARDAMPEGGTLTLSARNLELSRHDTRLGIHARDGAYVLLTVNDTGHGISGEIIDRIFDPFFTTKAIGSGTGLGLSTVLGIVRSHGGFVTAHSEPGHGSTFCVYLPAAPAGTPAADAGAVVEPLSGEGETILVVDDEASIVTTVQLCLEGHGYRVITARDGQDAIAQFITHRHEVLLVVTDVMMPVMDGLKLARALRRIAPTVPVIASSGLDPTAKSQVIAAGYIAEFLIKPYEPHVLLAAVRRQLRPEPPLDAAL